ncbi:MAG: hypothetical protein HYZ81_26370 [Nitrospinae bacterium]|nr:hypothetical protein [Nitrospinota bacterium]
MQVDGWVKRVDLAEHSAVITTRTGAEMTLHFAEGSYIEVLDPTTGGTMPGTLASLQQGYAVEARFEEERGVCHCQYLTSLS